MSKPPSDWISAGQMPLPGMYPTSADVDWADRQVADASARVEHLKAMFDEKMKRGRSLGDIGRLLDTSQENLRALTKRRAALFVEFTKGQPTTERDASEPQAS